MEGYSVSISEVTCLGASLTLSGIFYYLYKKNRQTLERLDEAPHFIIDGKLKNILKEIPGACLHYAVIEGAVQPVGERLTSQFHKDIVGVLQKTMLKQQRMLWNALSNTWTDSQLLLHQRVKAVPFVLVGSDGTTVKVLCPLKASGVRMKITHEKFHQLNYGLLDIIGQYLTGEKLKGQLETEEMLKVGSSLTGVGELILETDGTLNLRPPSNNAQYFLGSVDFDSLRHDQEKATSWWKGLTVASVLVGTAVLLWVGRRYYNHLKDQWQREEERRDFERWQEARRASAAGEGSEAPQELERVENPCVICLNQPRSLILLDCGHVCCCRTCYQGLPRRRCPICRQVISRVVPLYHM